MKLLLVPIFLAVFFPFRPQHKDSVVVTVKQPDSTAVDTVKKAIAVQKEEKKEVPKKTVSYKKDVYPILRKKCMSCHNTDDGSLSGLYFDDYDLLMKGDSKHGPVINVGDGEGSIMIKKLRGTAGFGKQMPRGKKSIDEDLIQTISTWIDQGAKDN